MPGPGVDVPPVEAVLHVRVRRLGVQAPLLGGGLAQEADGEEGGDEGRAGRQVEEELLPEGGEPVVSLRGGRGGGGGGGPNHELRWTVSRASVCNCEGAL